LRARKFLGNRVKKDELLGVISNPFGGEKIEIRAKSTGIIIGMTMMPLVNNGDALFHIATFEDAQEVEDNLWFYDDMNDA
jgi:predicted deacylase